MFWVIQNDLYRERGYGHLITTLEALGLPYVVVKLGPFLHKLLPEHFDSHAYTGYLDDVAEVAVDASGPVMICGSVDLSAIALERGWRPGTFLNANFDYEVWSQTYAGHILNADATVSRFDAVPERRSFFIRPSLDDKSFAGKVMNWGAYTRWRDDVLSGRDATSSVRPETLVVTAEPKPILDEHRFYVVDGAIVTRSRYKLNGALRPAAGATPEAEAFARRMIDLWQPARAFVLDVARVEDEGGGVAHRVVEIGCINSAGFYEADVPRLVRALEAVGNA